MLHRQVLPDNESRSETCSGSLWVRSLVPASGSSSETVSVVQWDSPMVEVSDLLLVSPLDSMSVHLRELATWMAGYLDWMTAMASDHLTATALAMNSKAMVLESVGHLERALSSVKHLATSMAFRLENPKASESEVKTGVQRAKASAHLLASKKAFQLD